MKHKKIYLLNLLLFIGMMLLQAQPVKEHGNLSVEATRIVDQNGNTVILRGVSHGWHNWWPRFYNKESVKWLADDWACTVVRAAMGIEPDDSYLDSSDKSRELMEAVIDAATHGQTLRDRGTYALEKGIPIFVSECAGMSANGDGPINYEAWHTWIDWMQKNQISMVFWSISDKDETCSMLTKSASSVGNWKESDLKESGLKTRELLRSFSQKN